VSVLSACRASPSSLSACTLLLAALASIGSISPDGCLRAAMVLYCALLLLLFTAASPALWRLRGYAP